MKPFRYAFDNDRKLDIEASLLDFSTYPNNLLGSFKKTCHINAKDGLIHFSYSLYSKVIGQDVTVELVFEGDEQDSTYNGYIHSLRMYTQEGTFFATSKNGDVPSNLNILVRPFLDYAGLECLINAYTTAYQGIEMGEQAKQAELEQTLQNIKEELKTYPKGRVQDVASSIRFFWKRRKGETLISPVDFSHGILDVAKVTGSLVQIPIFEKMAANTKQDQVAFMQQCVAKEKDSDIRHFLSRVVEDFEDSETLSIREYLSQWEQKWLGSLVVSPTNPFMRSSLGLPDYGSLHWVQDKFTCIPKKMRTSYVFDENLKPVSKYDPILEMRKWLQEPLSFQNVYESLMYINQLSGGEQECLYYYKEESIIGEYNHKLQRELAQYLVNVVEEALLPGLWGHLNYVSSSRIEAKRLYVMQESNDFAHILRNYFESKRYCENIRQQSPDEECYIPDSFMNRWVKQFGLGERIVLDLDEDGTGVKIRLVKEDGTSWLMADVGFGISQLMSIMLQIENAIMDRRPIIEHGPWGLHDIDGYDERHGEIPPTTIIIEEPEIHLHPKYQSLLADMFAEAMQKYNIHFIIETHSEYLIRRLQLLTLNRSENPVDRDDVAIYYVDNEPIPNARRIGICKNGYLDDEFGPGFYDEASRLSRELM